MSPSPDATTVDLSTPDGIADAFINHGVTLASVKGITDDDLEAVYAEAYGHLAEGRAQEAVEDLMLLVTHDPWEPRFQFAYALAQQLLGQHEAAAQHYAQALLMDATNAGCILRLGECMEAMGNLQEAEEAYRSCIQLSYLDPEYHLVRAHAQARLSSLNGGAA
ncbi:type III secretion system low calcium response chaperone LcrH/SycD [Acidovorax soli]|jgi:type III secretion system low calcium response chaperone LcrH/SycD|uniref:Type III secretion system low calcium response chaperone LcrH/SycD n=1 Tax=Acidovorax soli TaxID=592050 RepID=A0A7X0PB52_9BURK|nr:tetratricopeptide repeat protein [Acidovorax soli]MBB6558549.1 type III secretion system low calcium response chaperone LcrH/SycD [Acidovorax soli]